MPNNDNINISDSPSYLGFLDIKRYMNGRKKSQYQIHNNGTAKLFGLLCGILAANAFQTPKLEVLASSLPFYLDIAFLIDISKDPSDPNIDAVTRSLITTTRDMLASGSPINKIQEVYRAKYSEDDLLKNVNTHILRAPVVLQNKQNYDTNMGGVPQYVMSVPIIVPANNLYDPSNDPPSRSNWCNYFCLLDQNSNILAYVRDTVDNNTPFHMSSNETYVLTWNMSFINASTIVKES